MSANRLRIYREAHSSHTRLLIMNRFGLLLSEGTTFLVVEDTGLSYRMLA